MFVVLKQKYNISFDQRLVSRALLCAEASIGESSNYSSLFLTLLYLDES